MELGVKQAERFADITWLMEIIDLEASLSRLNIEMTDMNGTNWEGFCPDHYLFKGVAPSDPKWYLNIHTGETFCMTEGRGSNLLYVAARLLKKTGKNLTGEDCEEAVRFLTGRDCSEAEISFLKSKNLIHRLREEKKTKTIQAKTWITEIEAGIKSGYLSSKTIKYFLTPPDKQPTNIHIETLRHYDVFEKTNGYYANRAIVPIKNKGVIEGFIAIDILGKKRWMETHPNQVEKDYKKTLYPSSETGFSKKNVLFGFDDCEKNADYLILTEGAREVMKLWQEGFKNSVAILGSYMSEEQLMLLTTLAPKKLVLMFDGDRVGRQIAENVFEKSKDLFNIKVVRLNEGIDPKQLNREQFLALNFF